MSWQEGVRDILLLLSVVHPVSYPMSNGSSSLKDKADKSPSCGDTGQNAWTLISSHGVVLN
jgi:hypothetical protein